jgi:type I restriction enzyme, R subunit
VQVKEQVIKAAFFGILQDVDKVESLFTVISAQKEY